ncbi:hypothetical protein PSTG_17301 [Puccinia striiformis f. sp. tritici PST-78]|uniref:Uncharacterized protein n=1 Tax=Puccinia striiformis f. sp. tritici PST-78 TaxID=1165861 RepID=A0A0L0UQP8_9BASI|nr:hypothetical protein PSTG_17301 [Puccinia striiformis f. sp. tritici PST-78]
MSARSDLLAGMSRPSSSGSRSGHRAKPFASLMASTYRPSDSEVNNGHQAKKPPRSMAGTLPVILDIDPSGDRVIAAAVLEPSNKQRSDLPDDSALELAERKAQLVSLENDRNEIKNQIALLKADPRERNFILESELKQMLDAIKIPVQDRVFHLHGLSLFTSIISNPNIKNVVHAYSALKRPCSDSLEPATAQILSNKHLPATGGQDRRLRRSSWSSKSEGAVTPPPTFLGGNLRGPAITQSPARKHSLTAVPFQPSYAGTSSSSLRLDDLMDSNFWYGINIEREKDSTGMKSKDEDDRFFKPDVTRVSPEEHSPSTRPLVSNRHDEASPSSPTDVQPNPGGRVTQVEEIETTSGEPRRELYGDPLVIIKDVIQDHLDDGRMRIWNSLQRRLLGFEVWSSQWIRYISEDEAIFKLGFLQSVFLLSDYIHKHELLSAQLIDKIELSKLPAVMNTVQTHIQLLFRAWGHSFFDKPELVIPQIEFLATRPTLKHFHRTIGALPTHHHVYIVYAALRIITKIGPLNFDSKEASPRFHQFCSVFQQPDLLTLALEISNKLKNAPETSYPQDPKQTLIVNMIQDMIQFFQDPPRTKLSDQERLEFQMGFYMLDFADKYYQPILETALLQRPENRSIFKKQLEYMRTYLKFFQSRSPDPLGYEFAQPDEPFLVVYIDMSSENDNLRQWIKQVPLTLFHHDSWLYRLGLWRPPNFNLWMGQQH